MSPPAQPRDSRRTAQPPRTSASRASAGLAAGAAAAICLALAGCAGTPAQPADAAPTAWLSLHRIDAPLFGLRRARVFVDQRPQATLAAGETRVIAVTAGVRRVAVDLWDLPGQCEIALRLEPGQTLALRLSPRHETLAAATIGAAVPEPWTGLVLSLAAEALAGAGQACGGAFRVEPEPAPAGPR